MPRTYCTGFVAYSLGVNENSASCELKFRLPTLPFPCFPVSASPAVWSDLRLSSKPSSVGRLRERLCSLGPYFDVSTPRYRDAAENDTRSVINKNRSQQKFTILIYNKLHNRDKLLCAERSWAAWEAKSTKSGMCLQTWIPCNKARGKLSLTLDKKNEILTKILAFSVIAGIYIAQCNRQQFYDCTM